MYNVLKPGRANIWPMVSWPANWPGRCTSCFAMRRSSTSRRSPGRQHRDYLEMTGSIRRAELDSYARCPATRGVRSVASTTIAPHGRTDSSVKKRPSAVLIGRLCHLYIFIDRQLSASTPGSSPPRTGPTLWASAFLERVVSGFTAIVSGPRPPPSCAAICGHRCSRIGPRTQSPYGCLAGCPHLDQ